MRNRFYFLLIFVFFSQVAVSENLIELSKGSAKTINLDSAVSTVFMSDPKIADYKVINSKTIVLYGVDLGVSSIIIYNHSGKEIYKNNIIVNLNLDLIGSVIKEKFPDENISITNVSNNILLDGVVSSEEVKNKVYHMVGTFLEKKPERSNYIFPSQKKGDDDALDYTAKYYYEGIINNLQVLATNQINVKVTIAEVSSSFLTELGVSYGTNGSSTGVFVNKLLDFTAQDIVSVISALGNEGVGQILAEPNLTVFSGEQANFLVGGEVPIAVQEEDGITIHYKEYGIKLAMIAKVIDNNNIRLTLEPEVSSFDETHQTSTGLMNIPAFNTRKALTTVQLKDGQSFVLAGLLSSEDSESLSKVPYLSDIPILGLLFSSSKSVRSKKELIIVATVNLVTPVSTENVKLPLFKPTSDIERLLQVDFSSKRNESLELNDILSHGGFN
ncbi:MAG: type II and III secretion system protein family protein [Vibrio sp.]|uniref:type II and III secretion system protein family protein n=1 Tax=Vibrio sp. TaxID=678 RepID=UPI003A851878